VHHWLAREVLVFMMTNCSPSGRGQGHVTFYLFLANTC